MKKRELPTKELWPHKAAGAKLSRRAVSRRLQEADHLLRLVRRHARFVQERRQDDEAAELVRMADLALEQVAVLRGRGPGAARKEALPPVIDCRDLFAPVREEVRL